jgi:outer membrane protein OmpA-like peptidoglycan-associated protein
MMKLNPTAIAVLATLALGACATQQAAPPQLDAARSVVRQAEIDPVVLSSAPLELKKATDSLARADQLLAKGEPLGEVTSLAYVAERQARTAMALADAKRDENSIGAAEGERERARADVKEAEARRARMLAADAQARAGAAQGQAEMARQQAAEAEQRASNAQLQAVAAQSAAASAQQQAAALQQRLAELQAQETERGMLVTLGDVLFEFGRADIKPTAQASLRKLADFLQQYPDRSLLIEGHTDSVGSAPFNEQLSRQRAEAVAMALGAMGVAPQRVKVVGYGKSYPIADNSTDTNRALNRRVEVYISRTGEPVRMRG